jgi:hypothetical protein
VSLLCDRRTVVPRGMPHGPSSLERHAALAFEFLNFIAGPECKLAGTRMYADANVCTPTTDGLELAARGATWPMHRAQYGPAGPVNIQKLTIRFCGPARKKDRIGDVHVPDPDVGSVREK